MTLLIPLGGSLREIEISISLTLSTVIYRNVQNKQKWETPNTPAERRGRDGDIQGKTDRNTGMRGRCTKGEGGNCIISYQLESKHADMCPPKYMFLHCNATKL